jgi:peptidoglycan/xylan/chitin deacetylase (PgdA/CDA1 family)
MNKTKIKALALGMVLAWAETSAATAQQIALTFDDLPAHGSLPPGLSRQQVADSILKSLKEARVPQVYGFVNAVRVQDQPETIGVLEAWRNAGNPLGSHSWSHLNLDEKSLEAMETDVLRDEPMLQKMNAGDWHWYRYPYLAEGKDAGKRTAFRDFLQEHHYKIAGVTMSFGDYAWNDPYARCSAQGNDKAIVKLEDSYLLAAGESLSRSRAMAHALYGHDIPYVLLMHLGAFDARMLPRLLRFYKAQGVEFVSLEQAESDPFYVSDITRRDEQPDTLQAALAAKHLPSATDDSLPPELAATCK